MFSIPPFNFLLLHIKMVEFNLECYTLHRWYKYTTKEPADYYRET